MRDIAIEVGRALCDNAAQLGIGGLRCYEETFLQSLGWTAAALLLVAFAMASKGLRWSRTG
jgi:hypothetical protein